MKQITLLFIMIVCLSITGLSQVEYTSGGSGNAYTLVYPANITGLTNGLSFTFRANHSSTGAATLNINSLGAVSIKKEVLIDLVSNDILNNQIVTVVYDGTNFQMTSKSGNSGGSAAFSTIGNVTSNSSGTIATDDFVFGSASLNSSGVPGESRMYFDKSTGSFRAGRTNNTSWNETNNGTGTAAFGFNTVANGFYSFAAGSLASATGNHSVAIGQSLSATGDEAVAFGDATSAAGNSSMAIGNNNNSAAFGSFTGGNSNTANGFSSIAYGQDNTSEAYGQVTFGTYATEQTGNASSVVATDRGFVIGNGTGGAARSDAFTIYKSGNTEINGTVSIDADNLGGDTGYTLPGQDGDANYVMQTNGTGAVSWVDPSSLGGNGWGLQGNAGNSASDFVGTSDAQALRLSTNSTVGLFMDGTSQNIGVGTEVPLGKFHVAHQGGQGNVVFENASSGAADETFNLNFVRARNTLASKSSVLNGDRLGVIGFNGYNSNVTNFEESAQIIVEAAEDFISTGSAGRMIFRTTPSGLNTAQDAVTIDENQRLGIGTGSPTERLDVNGKTKTSQLQVTTGSGTAGQVLTSDASGNATWQAASAGSLFTDAGAVTYLTATGDNLAIGGTSASELLGVAPNSDVSAEIGMAHIGNVGSVGWAGFSHVNRNSATDFALRQNTNGLTYINAANSQAIRFSINDVESMRIHSTGNVGIGGGTSPELFGVGPNSDVSAEIGRAHIGNAGHVDWASFSHVDSDGPSSYAIRQNTNGFTMINAGAGNPVALKINDVEYARLHSSGNFGIGTTSPSATLDLVGTMQYVDGNEALNRVLTSDASGNATWQAVSAGSRIQDGDNDTYVETANTNEIEFNVNNTLQFKMKGAQLEVLNSNSGVFIGQATGDGNTGANNTFIGFQSGLSNTTGANNTFLGRRSGSSTTSGSGNIAIGANAGPASGAGALSNKLYIDNQQSNNPLIGGDFSSNQVYINGFLGVGTLSPTTNLHVTGGHIRHAGAQPAGSGNGTTAGSTDVKGAVNVNFSTTGSITVTFSTAFSDVPTVILTPLCNADPGALARYWVSNVTTTGFVVNWSNMGSTPAINYMIIE